MKCYLRGGAVIVLALLLAPALPLGRGEAVQFDYRGSENIGSQEWSLEFTLRSMGEDNFSVRLPFPDYTYVGKWASYGTHEVSVSAVGECGPILCELHHYNEGFSNQGVWLKIVYPCPDNRVYLAARQSAKLDLPGLDYPLTFHTNNPWMDGSDIVDAYSSVVGNVLSEALALGGDWHEGGGRSVPERIVNWMNENMSWSGSGEVHYPKSASQVLTERQGRCEEWAHAACALLIRAGIPAKVVMAGPLPTYNSTLYQFGSAQWHLSTAYWDGFGWILIDPNFSSGFSIANRVILGADRDSWNLKMRTHPDYLIDHLDRVDYLHTGGSYSGYLSLINTRCHQYPEYILEHYEFGGGSSPQGSEPKNNIIPNIPTDAEYTSPVVAGLEFTNFPNPFNPLTTFRFNVHRPGRVRIDLYSVDGRHLEVVLDRYCDAGRYELSWNSSSTPSGVYFARIATVSGTASRKVVILR